MASNDTTGALPPIARDDFHAESIAYQVIVAAVLGPSITIPICILRLYTKRCILRNIGYDDYAIAIATLLALGFSITTGFQIRNGMGSHIWDVPAYKLIALMKISGIPAQIFYTLSTLFTKTSLCLFYLRFSPFKTFRIVVYVVMVVSIVYSLLAAICFVWVCRPIEKLWDFSITTGTCIDIFAFFLANACINAATDLALLVLPLFIVKKLHLPTRRKIGVALLLMTGSVVCVVSLIRVENTVKRMHTATIDFTWGMVASFIWLLIETWLGIICTCIPALHTFVRSYLDKRKVDANDDLHVARGGKIDRVGPNLASESACFEEMENMSLELLESGTCVGGISGVRPVASNSTLLRATSTGND